MSVCISIRPRVTFRVSHGNLSLAKAYLPTHLHIYTTVVTVMTVVTIVTVGTVVTVVTKKIPSQLYFFVLKIFTTQKLKFGQNTKLKL